MKRTVTIVVAVLAILGIAGAGVAYMVGKRAEEGYHAALAGFNGQMPGVELENASYERGLFGAQARTVLRMEDEEIAFEHRISHVPRPGVRVETRFAPGEDVRAFFAEQGLEDFLAAPVVTEIDFSGRSSTRYSLPALSREITEASGETVTIESRGLDLTVDLSADLRDVACRFSFPYLRVDSDGARMELKAVSSELDSRWEEGLAIGKSRVDLESFLFELDREPRYAAFALQGLNMSSHNDIVDDFYGGAMRLDARELALGGKNFGPLELELALEHLSAPSLRRLQAELESLSRQDNHQEAQLQLVLAMGEIIPELLSHRPRLVLKTLGLRGEEGEIRGKGMAAFEGEIASADFQQQLSALVADFDLDLSPALLATLIRSAQYLQAGVRPGGDEQLDGLIVQLTEAAVEQLKTRNILVEDGARLKLNFHLEKMQPTLNGQPLAL